MPVRLDEIPEVGVKGPDAALRGVRLDSIAEVPAVLPARAQYLETPQEAGTRAKEAFELAVAENIPLDMATQLTNPQQATLPLPGLVSQIGWAPYHMGRRAIGGTLETGQLALKGAIRAISDAPAVLLESPKARLIRHGSFAPNLLEQAGILSPDMASWLRDVALPVIADAMPEQMSLAKTPGAAGDVAVKMLRGIGETGTADILEKMQTVVTENVRAKARTISEVFIMELLHGKMLESLTEETKPYLGETPAESVKDIFTNPQLLAERVGSMLPYMAGTVALAIATEGMAAPFVLTYLIEGEDAAQAAADRGASPAEQSDIGQIVGFINGAVEMWQVSTVLKFVGGPAAAKAFAKKASDVAVAKVATSAVAKSTWAKGASVGVELIKMAASEAGQEVLQQANQEIATSGITNEPLEPGFWERLILAGGVAGIASILTAGLFAGGQKALGIKSREAAAEAAAAPPASAETPVGAETPPAAAVAPAQPEDAKARKDAPLVELMAAEDALEMAFAAVRAAKPADLSAAKKSMVAAAVTWEAALARYTTWRDADVALAPAQPETVPEVGDETGVDRGMVVLPRGEPAAAERVVPEPEPSRDLM
ncbi:hypothetical protein IMZ48_19555, partial [Candidatus Bathyarchaeota archaeon]|nr:hypothetical protein [Candidatus Bathyarchaeota archaeon]